MLAVDGRPAAGSARPRRSGSSSLATSSWAPSSTGSGLFGLDQIGLARPRVLGILLLAVGAALSLHKGDAAVAKLIYSAIASLDGYVADERGEFEWAAPDEEVHAFVNDLERPIGTYLYGRRMYDVMVAWETMPTAPTSRRSMRDYAHIWRAADKVVYSTTLDEPRAPGRASSARSTPTRCGG